MAAITNTYQTYQAKGIRESLSNVIYNISPEDTPFMSNGGRENVENTFFEWQLDSLAATDTANKHIEGDDVTSFAAVVPTSRVGNRTQISRKTLIIAGTTEAVKRAGRGSEREYQLAKLSAELKRDMEAIVLSNQASAAGNATTARATGSLLAFLFTNTSFGAAGADPVYTTEPNATRTDGTQRAFTEALLKTVLNDVWTSGGKPRFIMRGGLQKQVFSGFAGIAEVRKEIQGNRMATIVGAADVYVSDFGNLTAVPNRFQRNRDAFLLDPDMYSFAYLR